jgi:hypothetical protein
MTRRGRGDVPDEAKWVEYIVGQLDIERSIGRPWSAREFSDHAQRFGDNSALPALRAISDGELNAVRSRLDGLIDQWHRLPPGVSV